MGDSLGGGEGSEPTAKTGEANNRNVSNPRSLIIRVSQ
jgi:hypothetical protein